MPDTNAPSIGHNSGTINPAAVDLADLLHPGILTDQWSLDHADGIERRDALLANVEKFKASHPDGITTEAGAEVASDIVAQLRAAAKVAENLHEPAKAPFLAAGRAADAFFIHDWAKKLIGAIPQFVGSGVRGEPLGLVTQYHRAKAEKEKLAREEAARLAKEEADRAAEAAARTMTPDVVDNAIHLEEKAQVAESAARAPVSEMTRSRGVASTSSLRDNWTYEIVDRKLLLQAVLDGKVSENYVLINESAINAAIRGKNGLRDIPGLRIWNAQKSGVR